jgi:nucleotide-binding universal stress UspA family protein
MFMTRPEVVAVGFGQPERDRRVLIWAAREANRRHRLLRVVHAFALAGANGRSPAPAAAHNAVAREQLADIVTSYPDIQIETTVQAGWSLASIADDGSEPELTVMPAVRDVKLEPLLLGCSDDSVARRRHAVVVLPDAPVASGIERIVVGADGSLTAAAAVLWAADEAELWGADLTIVHAWDYPYRAAPGERTDPNGAPAPQLMREAATQLVSTTIAALRSQRPLHSGDVQAQIVEGPTVSALLETARKNRADLLVLGTRGRGPAALGSTVDSVLHRATCALAVVPTPP